MFPASGCFKCHYYLIRFLDFYVGVFVIGLSQISFFISNSDGVSIDNDNLD